MSSDPSAPLKYDILGENTMSEEDKIAKYTGDVDWEYMKPHYQSGAMIYADPSLDLQQVAKAFSDDDKEQVQAWLKKADLVKPDNLHADWWEHDQTRFNAAVVHPFVIAQPITSE